MSRWIILLEAKGWCGPTLQIAMEYIKWIEQVKNPNWQEADHLAMYTSAAEELNHRPPKTNPAGGEGRTWNHDKQPSNLDP